jgi:hypothetical protein
MKPRIDCTRGTETNLKSILILRSLSISTVYFHTSICYSNRLCKFTVLIFVLFNRANLSLSLHSNWRDRRMVRPNWISTLESTFIVHFMHISCRCVPSGGAFPSVSLASVTNSHVSLLFNPNTTAIRLPRQCLTLPVPSTAFDFPPGFEFWVLGPRFPSKIIRSAVRPKLGFALIRDKSFIRSWCMFLKYFL